MKPIVGSRGLGICIWMHVCVLSRFSPVWLFATLWTVAHQAPLSMGFSRQEYWSGLPCPPPGVVPDPGIGSMSPVSPALQADSLPLSHWGSPMYMHKYRYIGSIIKGWWKLCWDKNLAVADCIFQRWLETLSSYPTCSSAMWPCKPSTRK